VLWLEVDLAQRQVEVSSTVIRWNGHGLVRKDTKTRAGRRILVLPSWAVADLQRRWARGVRLEDPVFSNSLGGLRDPKNTRHAGERHLTARAGLPRTALGRRRRRCWTRRVCRLG